MTARYPLVLNGQSIQELQDGDTLQGVTSGMIGLENVDNTSDINKPVSTAQQTALDLKANINADTTGTAAKATNLKGGNTTTLNGAIHYQSGVDVSSILAPNVTTTKKFLRETGDGTNGTAPAWDTLVIGDLPTVTPAKGGTGVANGTNNTLTFTGNYTLNVTLSGNTAVTLPASGTLLASGGALGTPASGNASNLTNFPTLNQNTSGTAANLSGTPTLPTGTTLVAPNLGTPASGTLTNCTGLPQAGLATNVAGTGPVFQIYKSTPQSTSNNTIATILFDGVNTDTASAYTAATGKFQPTVAGYYQINASVQCAGTSMTFMTAYILKNGSQFASSTQQGTLNTGTPSCSVSALTYLNGSTDYITVAGYLSASAAWTVSGQASGFLARKA